MSTSLRTLEALLSLRRPSNLGTPALAQRVLAAAEGILGEVVAIPTRAAAHAVTTGTEAITVDMIVATVGIGFYDATIEVEGFWYAYKGN